MSLRVKVRFTMAFVLALCSAPLPAQSGFPPPAYDYVGLTPGIQPPTFLQGTTYDYRSVRTYQVSIPVVVPLSELQAVMPTGFQATATPAGSNTGTLTLGFFLDQRFERTGLGQSFGPVSALLVSTTALNSNVSPARVELVFPAFESSAEIPALNAVFGAGSARLAAVDVSVEQQSGEMRFQFEVSDPSLGLKLKAQAIAPIGMNTRSVSDPVGLPFRTFTGLTANHSFRAASQSDAAVVPMAMAGVKIQAAGHRLHFPAGSVSISGLGASVTFNRNIEFIVKFE